MHIVYATLTKMGGGGGDVIHVSELAEELVRCGARVTLIASGRPNPPLAGVESIDAGRIVSRGFFTRIFTFSLLVLRVLLQVVRRRSRSDVIYTRDALLACWLATWRRLFRLPVVFEVNGLRADESRMLFGAFFGRWVCAIGRRAERTAARHADRLICVTAGIRDVLRDEYGVPPERMDVVPNGVNLRLFTPEVPAERREQLRKELGIRPDDAVICYLGGLQPWQDVSTLIQAAGRVKLADRGVILLIAGDGRKRRQWEDEARRL
ncbi:MAG: glycosyltransferase, partial [Sedimentisphaerales bacterium]|nr:glycosyltransferase [Sedimentisphaerales bacterium]